MDSNAGNENPQTAGSAGLSQKLPPGCWWRWPLYGLLLLPLVIFLFSLLGRFSYLAELMGNFRFYWLAMLLPPFLLAALLRWRRWTIILGLAVVWASLGTASSWLPAWQPAPGRETLRILTYNVRGDNYRHDGIKSQIRELDPDVLVVVEYSTNWWEQLEDLRDRWPHQVTAPRWHGFGIAIFSKRPIRMPLKWQLTPSMTDNPVVGAELELEGRRIRILGVHLFSPTNPPRMRLRNRQLEELPPIVLESDLPTIVAGDFNCTSWSPYVARFLRRSGLRDSRQGFGYQASWHTRLWPMRIPIDHFFVSSDWHVHDRNVAEAGSSDHYPVLIEVSLGPDR